MPLAKYVSEFELKANELKDLMVVLPGELLAFKLLKNAGLSEVCARIVRIACNTNNADGTPRSLTLAIMKATILNAFDCRLDIKETSFGCTSNTSGTVSMEPFRVKSEPLDTFYTDQRYRDGANQSYGKTRGLGRNNSGRFNSGRSSFEPYPGRKQREHQRRDIDNGKSGYASQFDQADSGYGRPQNHRVNRIDRETGRPSECNLCGSVYHWQRQCQRYREPTGQGSAMEAHIVDSASRSTVDITLLSQSLNEAL